MRRWWLFWVLWALACSEDRSVVASTQVDLTVEVDPALRAQAETLRASLWMPRSGGGWGQRSQLELRLEEVRWPLVLPIVAHDAEDEAAELELIVEAFSGTARLAQARVLTRFVRGELSYARVSLFACPDRPSGFVCAADDCHGASCGTCNADGECVAMVPELAEQVPDASAPRDAELPEGAREPDAQASGPVDAGGTPPTSSEQDGGMDPPMASCPEPNPCPLPYPCVPTPAGYTCQGQMADWPMPDAVAGARHAPRYTAGLLTVIDEVTQLEWQINIPRIFPGCTEFDTGDVGEYCSQTQARAYCEQLVLDGHDDWRLASMIEMVSLLNNALSSGRQGVDARFFGDFDDGIFVTSSLGAGSPTLVWGMNYFARVTRIISGYTGKPRCVRAGALATFATPADRYAIDEVADTVTDRGTGLVWKRTLDPRLYTFEELATAPCAAPFRMPTTNELVTLVDPARSEPAIDLAAFPNTPGEPFWAYQADTMSDFDPNPVVDFAYGELDSSGAVGAHVRCVQ